MTAHDESGIDPFPNLFDEELRLMLFGGKGGVGKTTMAAAFSLHLSDRYPRKRILILSADPAHSLSDSFRFPLNTSPTPIYGLANLQGVELDAPELLELFRRRHGETLKEILGRGTYLDREDLARFLELSFPGLDEVMVLLHITDLLDEGAFDLLVLDTAPTGHTLRLLELPRLMRAWTAFLDTLMAKHRYLARLYTGRYRPDEADRFIDSLTGGLDAVRKLLQDGERCRFVPVTMAEPMVLAETSRLLRTLLLERIRVDTVLVNHARVEVGGCRRCLEVTQRQKRGIEAFGEEWPGLELRLISALPEEPVGEEALRAFGAVAWSPPEGEAPGPIRDPEPAAVCLAAPNRDVQLLLICGKGGVGKTTVASAFALELSRSWPDRRILLFSTDPAHSLSDCLGQSVGSVPTRVTPTENLYGVEIDPASLFEKFKGDYARQIEEVFEEFLRGGDMEVPFDRDVMAGLLDLAPPGLDEIMALAELTDYVDEERFDLYVLDTAPTGHALRLLELPALVRQWLSVFFEIVLKYRSVVRLPGMSELLVDLSKKVKKLQGLLADVATCECTLVSIATEVALNETERLARSLARLEIPVRRVLVNRMFPEAEGCPYCGASARAQQEICRRYRQVFPGMEVTGVPDWPSDLTGVDALSRLVRLGDHPAPGA